jgi:hypothetical protein
MTRSLTPLRGYEKMTFVLVGGLHPPLPKQRTSSALYLVKRVHLTLEMADLLENYFINY